MKKAMPRRPGALRSRSGWTSIRASVLPDPWIIGFVVFKAVPFGQSLYYSFTDLNFFEVGTNVRWPAATTSRLYHHQDHQGAAHHLQVRLHHRAPEADLRAVHRIHPELQDRMRQPVPYRVLHPSILAVLLRSPFCGRRVQRGRPAQHRAARCHLWSGAGPRVAV